MAKSSKSSDDNLDEKILGMDVQETRVEAPKQLDVPSFSKPDINKVIEERRKAVEQGKIINK